MPSLRKGRADSRIVLSLDLSRYQTVGCSKSVIRDEQWLDATRSYSLIQSCRIGRRLMRSRLGTEALWMSFRDGPPSANTDDHNQPTQRHRSLITRRPIIR